MRMPRLDKHAGFISQPDPRLNEASAAKWGASFLTDHEFRMLLTAYFVWDHQGWAVFDSDDFCGALTGASSELSSRLLVLAVLTQAAVREPKLITFRHFTANKRLRGSTCTSMPNCLLNNTMLGLRPYNCGKQVSAVEMTALLPHVQQQ